jgi:hypothetical protein
MSEQQQPQQDNGGAVLVAVLAGLAVAVALPLVIGWKAAPVLAEQPRAWQAQRRQTLAAVAAGVVAVGLFVLAMFTGWLSPLPLGWNTAAVVVLWWAATAPLGYAVARARFGYLATAVAEGRHDPRTADRVRRAVWAAAQRNAAAKAQALQDPRALGAALNDDRRDIVTRLRDSRDRSRRKHSAWLQADTLTLPPTPPRAVVLGGSGSGKTTTLRALTRAALAARWRVVIIDAKGSRPDAAQMLADATSLGATVKHWPSVPFDGWRGDGASVATKAATLLPSDAPVYYRQRAESALYAVAGSTPWRNSGDLLGRLTTPAPWVNRYELDALTRKEQGTPVHLAVAGEVRAALRGVNGLVDGGTGSWSWDDEQTDLVVVSVDLASSSAHRIAAGLMLADLNAYRLTDDRRGPNARPLLVIIDEAAGLLDDPQAPDVALLAEQVRSQGVGIVVAAQSVQGLGKVQGPRLLNAGGDLFAGRMSNPDEAAKLAGTVRVQEVAHQGTASGATRTGQTAAREQAQHRLDPDRLRETPTGCFAVVEVGQPVRWVQIRPAAHHHGATLPGPELRAAQRPRLSDLFPPEERPEVSPPRAEVDEGDEPDPFQDWGTP